jgi:RNA polymerase sigma factor (sigma-70 family)
MAAAAPDTLSLVTAAQQGDTRAEEALLAENAGIVGAAVCRVLPRLRHDPRITGDDLAQAGRLGLLRAIRAYQPGLAKFSTFASVAVGRAVARAIDAELRRPGHVSIDAPVEEAGDGTLAEVIADDRPGPEERLLAGVTRAELRVALSQLPLQLRDVILLRYGLGGAEPLTCRAAAARLGITAQTVSLRERRGLARLRELLASEEQRAA